MLMILQYSIENIPYYFDAKPIRNNANEEKITRRNIFVLISMLLKWRETFLFFRTTMQINWSDEEMINNVIALSSW